MTAQSVIGILMALTAISSYINYKFVKLPKSIGITLVTLVLTLLVTISSKLGWDVHDVASDLLSGICFNETFLHGMLSFLLFAGSLHLNAIELAKQKFTVATLSTVSVVISTVLIGYATHGLTQLLEIPLPFPYCFVFGALISPTDPIAVLGILKTAGAPKSLENKIAGEALFNDGMGIILFVVTLKIASGAQNFPNATEISLCFIRQTLGGVLFGSLMGWLAAMLLRTINDYDVAIIWTLAIVTGGYTLAHSVMSVSGPICMALTGLIIGSSLKNGKMSKRTLQRLGAFWELLDEVLNTILCVLIGLEFINIRFNLPTTLAAIGAIVISIAARWISISIPILCLSRFKPVNPDILMAMTWGGLRGGISIALALSITGSHHNVIIAITYAVVLFSIVVQGLTIGPLVRKIAQESPS